MTPNILSSYEPQHKGTQDNWLHNDSFHKRHSKYYIRHKGTQHNSINETEYDGTQFKELTLDSQHKRHSASSVTIMSIIILIVTFLFVECNL